MELFACPVCHGSLEFHGNLSHYRLSKGLLKCAKNHLYPVKDEIAILKDQKMSEKEFAWQVDFPDLKRYERLQAEYNSYLSPDQLEADKSLLDTISKVASKERLVLDVASGMGRLLLALSTQLVADQNLLGTDIDKKPLHGAKLKLKGQKSYTSVSLCVMDGKHLAIKDEKIPCVTSFFGFNNIPETKLAFREISRVMTSKGQQDIAALFLEENSASLKLAEQLGYGAVATEERLEQELVQAGFSVETTEKFYEGRWPHNPMDRLPLQGDWFAHAFVRARKISGG